MGHIGRLWQLLHNYIYKEAYNMKKEKEKEKNKKKQKIK